MTTDHQPEPTSWSDKLRRQLPSPGMRLRERLDADSLVTNGFYLYTALLVLFLWTPLLIVVFLSFAENSTAIFPFEGFTLRHYAATALNERLIEAALMSIQIATVSASGATVLGVLASFGIVRYKFRFKGAFVTAGLLPLVIPGVIFGASFLIFYNTILDSSTGFWPLVLAHSVYGFPFVMLAVLSRLYIFDESLEESARDLGADLPRAFWDITFPIIRPAIGAGFLFAWIRSFEDFMRALFISGTLNVLTIEMFSLIRFGRTAPINVVSSIIFVLIAVVLVVAMRLGNVVDYVSN